MLQLLLHKSWLRWVAQAGRVTTLTIKLVKLCSFSSTSIIHWHHLSFNRPQSDMSFIIDFQSNSKIFALGVIISAMLYGGVATLALTYIPLLLKTSHTISRRMRNFLLAYVTFMVATSTINTVTLIIAFTIGHSIFDYRYGSLVTVPEGFVIFEFPNGLVGSLCITFASWGADGFMVSLLKW